MAAPPVQPAPEEEDEYESDEYDVEDDGEGDADFKDAQDDEDEDEDESGDEEESSQQNLTALLVADPNSSAQAVDEEEDEIYAPPGETKPAGDVIDGNTRAEAAGKPPLVEDLPIDKVADRIKTSAPAAGIKRKTSGDEDDEDDEGEEDPEAKKLKA